MRIELNAGGLRGLVSVAEFGFSIEALDDDLDLVISSFQAVKSAVKNLEGGVGDLGDAIDSLQRRIYTEETKKRNLADLSVRFDDFLDLTVSIDRDVARLVNRNREEFYQLHEHLRPIVAIEEYGWNPFAALWDAICEIGGYIIDAIVEYADEALVICVTAVAFVGGAALIIFTGGAAGIILGCALIGGGLGMLLTSANSYRENGDVDLLESLAGFGLGAVAGAAIGGCLYGAGYMAATYKGIGGFLASQAIQGGGTSMAMDFFEQTILNGDAPGFADYDVLQTLYQGAKSAATSMVVGSLFKFTGISGWFDAKTGNLIGKFTSSQNVLVHVASGIPANMIEGAAEGLFGESFDLLVGGPNESFEWGKIGESVLSNVLFGMVSDSVEFGVIKKQRAQEMAARIRHNVEQSRIAREASNIGTGTLSYSEHPISSKGLKKLLRQRGLSDSEIADVMGSFNKYADAGELLSSPSMPRDITVKRTRPEGEIRWVYSTKGDASGIFTTRDLYFDNRTGMGSLATPASNAFLQAEKVIIPEGQIQINGTVAPQHAFTADAMSRGLDDVIRRGGGIQTVTNGGFATGAVKRTGEIRRLFDTANRVKLLNPATQVKLLNPAPVTIPK